MDEDTVLKTAGCKSFAGSIPVSSANRVNALFKKHKWCTSAKGKQLDCESSDTGSIPKYTPIISTCSLTGRALAYEAKGYRFDPYQVLQTYCAIV